MSYSYLTKTQWGQKSSCLICFFSRQHCVLAEVIWTFILTLCSFIKSRGFFLMSYIHVSFPPICQISFNCALYFTCLVFVLYYAFTFRTRGCIWSAAWDTVLGFLCPSWLAVHRGRGAPGPSVDGTKSGIFPWSSVPCHGSLLSVVRICVYIWRVGDRQVFSLFLTVENCM